MEFSEVILVAFNMSLEHFDLRPDFITANSLACRGTPCFKPFYFVLVCLNIKLLRLCIFTADLSYISWMFEYLFKTLKILLSHVIYGLPLRCLTGLMNWVRRLKITALQGTTSVRWYSLPFDITPGHFTLMLLSFIEAVYGVFKKLCKTS